MMVFRDIILFFCIGILCVSSVSFLFANNSEDGIRIAIMGDGGKTQEKTGVDWQMMAQLFKQIRREKPRAVFFTGNLISGLEQSTTAESVKEFENTLNIFSELVKTHFGNEIPVYTVMGNHTFVNSRAVAIFRKHFEIENAAPLESYQLAYDVYLDHVQFVVLATGDYERKFRGYRYYATSMPLLDWLEKTLRTDANGIRYRFVIGHEPGFSSGFSEGRYVGMDKDPERRDLFWKILRQNNALAYFCSHQSIYDRSNRGGVWQVISGGVTVFDVKGEKEENVFPHHILLTIPKNEKSYPFVTVIDHMGKIWDEFELVPIDRP
ncbi:MAG: metallophosphoesterase family protein, partial [Waddliaceae bacterium]